MQTNQFHIRKYFIQIQFMFICFFLVGCNLLNASSPFSHGQRPISQPWDNNNSGAMENSGRLLMRENYFGENPSLLKEVWNDMHYMIQEPDFYLVVGGLAATPGVFKSAFKREDPEFAEMWGKSKFADEFFESGDGFGNSAYHFGTALLTYFTGKFGHYTKLEEFGSDLFRAQTVNGLMTLSLKGLVNRTRPNGGPFSFPSGHTSTVFATATVVYHDFGPIWGSAAYLGATYVGFSRMQANKHYLSDIIGGAFLGTYLTFKVLHRKDEEGRLEIKPLIGKDYNGLNLQMRF